MRSRSLTNRESRKPANAAAPSASAATPKLQRQATSAPTSEGWRKAVAIPTRTGLARANLPHHQVHQLPGHYDRLHHLFAIERSANFLVRQGQRAHRLVSSAGGHQNTAAELAIDLHWNLDFFFLGERRIVL